MKRLLQNPVFRFSSDLRPAALILAIFAIASGVGTWVEAYYANLGSLDIGRAAVFELVYDAVWFNALLGLLFVNLLMNLIQQLLRGRRPTGFLLVHVGMLLILAGAGVTRWWGYEGTLRIREGQASKMVASSDAFAVVVVGSEEAALPVRLYKPGPQSHRKRVALGGETLTLGVSEFWPRFERRLEPGPGGIARVQLAAGPQGMNTHGLQPGDYLRTGGVVVRFFEDDFPTSAGRYGDLQVRVGGEICRFPVESAVGLVGECSGWTFELIELRNNVSATGDPGAEGPVLSPMIRLGITAPTGERIEKSLFARHPTPGTAHGESGVFAQIDLSYESGNTLGLAKLGETVVMRAPFPFEVRSAGDDAGRAVAVGEVVSVEAGQLIRGKAEFQIMIRDVAASLVWGGVGSTDPDAPAAARVYVEQGGERADAICVRDDEPQLVAVDGREVGLRYGSVLSELPYEIFLDDFVLQTYPGSDSPASYESHVLLNDAERGIADRPVRIWMNHPLNHRGTKHFQSSYDPDRRGTVLAINRDPGKLTTYLGYTVITLGFLIIILSLIYRRVVALRQLASAAVVLTVCGLAALPDAAAQEQPLNPAQVASPGNPPELILSAENLEAASRLIVQDFRGRMKPLDTLARETAMKITRSTHFEGREPVGVFLGFAVHPEAWYGYPAIHVKDPGVQALLGIDRPVRYVPLSSVLRDDGYTIGDVVEEAHRTPSNRRDKTQQKLIVFDERVHLLFGALQGNPLRIFPIPDDPGHTWQSIDKALGALSEGDPRAAEFRLAAGTLFDGLLAEDDDRIGEGLHLVHELQLRYGAAVIPAKGRIDSELALNRTRPFAVSILPYLLGFVLLIIAFFVGLLARNGWIWSWKSPLYALGMVAFVGGFAVHLWGFVLRWIASARAPLSNGHESLLWVALAVALAGVVFELVSRTAAVGALASLLTAVVLGVSMLGTFDPSIGPLMPVLASYWLNIHVTVITASYGFFGLCSLLGLLTLVLVMINRGRHRDEAVRAIGVLDRLNVDVMIVGIGLLTVGTLLGGVWANESWGRYWGWDPKETWALVSILLYAMILHFRWIPKLANPFVQAVSSFLAVWSIIMTYFGVNYLLMGMHSYAAGDKVAIPPWAVVSFLLSVGFCILAFLAWSGQRNVRRRESAQGLHGSAEPPGGV